MNEMTTISVDADAAAGKHAHVAMKEADSHEWRLWVAAILVTILLSGAIASFALPGLLPPKFSDVLNDAIRGLLALVALFNAYVIYKQLQINRIRRSMADQLYTMAVLDPLTGLFNRRYIQHRLEQEVARCQRHGTSLTVILFDLDRFKHVNDKHGHGVGDDFLKAFSERLKRATRGSDVAARYGGDEFIVVLSDCKPEGVQYVLKRLGNMEVGTTEGSLPVGYSAGWADYNRGESLDQFLKRVDEQLYVRKREPHAILTP